MSEKELIQEIKKLYDNFEPVRQYYGMELSDDSEKVLAEFKARIKKEYFPNRGFGRASSKASRKVVSDFKKRLIFTSKSITEYVNCIENKRSEFE